jgi:acid stress-induced BolA-like protein IbaG/YrbA
MLTADELRNTIANGLPCDHVEVLGDDGQHFEAVIVSPQFAGKNRVQQHQLVYQALGDRMRTEIHALSLKTFAPDAWAGSSTK